MFELTMIGAAMKVAFWVLQFFVSAPDPALLPPPTQTQFEIAFPSIPKEPIDYEN
jgi:hypothetical protein